MKHKDLELKDSAWILEKVETENKHQLTKWGVQTHSAFKWFAIIAEEVGELATSILEYLYNEDTNVTEYLGTPPNPCGKDGSKERVVHEATQVATLALKIAEMFEKSEEESNENKV